MADKAVDYATRAGDAAMATSAPDDAMRWYRLALEHLDGEGDVATEVDVLTRLARAQQQTALGEVRDTVIRAASSARRAGLADAMAEALLLSARTSFDEAQPEDPEKIALLEDAIERLDDPALRARAQAALAVELIYVGDTRRFALLDEALAVARSSGDPLALVDASRARFNARSRATWHGDAFREEAQLAVESRAAAETLDDPFWLANALAGSGYFAIVTGDGPALRDALDRLHEFTERFDTQEVRRSELMIGQMAAAIAGDLVLAEALSAELYALLGAMDVPEAFTYRATMGFAGRREQDRLHDLLPRWGAAPAAADPVPEPDERGGDVHARRGW